MLIKQQWIQQRWLHPFKWAAVVASAPSRCFTHTHSSNSLSLTQKQRTLGTWERLSITLVPLTHFISFLVWDYFYTYFCDICRCWILRSACQYQFLVVGVAVDHVCIRSESAWRRVGREGLRLKAIFKSHWWACHVVGSHPELPVDCFFLDMSAYKGHLSLL